MKGDLELLRASHNRAKYDFPLLRSQCVRADLRSGIPAMARWRFVDTLDVLRATCIATDCKKLQTL